MPLAALLLWRLCSQSKPKWFYLFKSVLIFFNIFCFRTEKSAIEIIFDKIRKTERQRKEPLHSSCLLDIVWPKVRKNRNTILWSARKFLHSFFSFSLFLYIQIFLFFLVIKSSSFFYRFPFGASVLVVSNQLEIIWMCQRTWSRLFLMNRKQPLNAKI